MYPGGEKAAIFLQAISFLSLRIVCVQATDIFLPLCLWYFNVL